MNTSHSQGAFAVALTLVSAFVVVARAENFVVPQPGELFIKSVGGIGDAVSDFGLGTNEQNYQFFLGGLPNHPVPDTEVSIGQYNQGDIVKFAMRTTWGTDFWAFSDNLTEFASLEAFTDRNGSLGWNGSIIELVGSNLWLMHLDDGASVDDDDNDIYIQLRLAPVPEPTSLTLFALACVAGISQRTGRDRP